MDLGTVARMMTAAARKHPSRRTVTLRNGNGDHEVELAIPHTMSQSIGGGTAVVSAFVQYFVLLKEFCAVVPMIGDVIVDGSDLYSVRSVDRPYGGLAYRCVVDLQQ